MVSVVPITQCFPSQRVEQHSPAKTSDLPGSDSDDRESGDHDRQKEIKLVPTDSLGHDLLWSQLAQLLDELLMPSEELKTRNTCGCG